MTGLRHPQGSGARNVNNGHSPEPGLQTDDEIDASFRRLRLKIRILLSMTSASFVLTVAIFIAVVCLERSI
jgi:hypothetical protein